MSAGLSRSPVLMIVDDEPDILLMLHRIMRDLAPKNYDVQSYVSGIEALTKIMLQRVAVVLIDYYMPDMNGLKLAQEIREFSPATFIIMMTAYATPDLQVQVQPHIDAFLPKPFPIDKLELLVKQGLAQYKLHAAAAEAHAEAYPFDPKMLTEALQSVIKAALGSYAKPAAHASVVKILQQLIEEHQLRAGGRK